MAKRILLIIIGTAIAFAGCSSSARFTDARQDREAYEEKTAGKELEQSISDFNPEEVKDPLEVEIGIASYYAEPYHGRPTASGVIYDMNGISAAHPFHPLGTIARITNMVNQKSLILEINDRMPYRPDRIIDLSLGAAKELDMLIVGIQKVKIEVLKWGTGKRIERIKNPF